MELYMLINLARGIVFIFPLHLDSAAVEDGVCGRGWPPDHTQELVSRSTAGGAASAIGPHAAWGLHSTFYFIPSIFLYLEMESKVARTSRNVTKV